MSVDMAKVNRVIETLETALDSAQEALAEALRVHEADKLRHRQFAEQVTEITAKQEAASDILATTADKAVARVRALEHFIVSKGLWEDFCATAAPSNG